MVTHWKTAALALVGSLTLAAASAQDVSPTATTIRPGEVVLEVQATGTAQAVPDTASLSIGVVSTGTTVSEAATANATAMTRILAAVRRAGVDPRWIRTQQIGVQPRFARNGPNDFDGQAQITGYVARNSLSVTLIKPNIAPAVIGAAYEAGANSVSGPNLSLQDDKAALTAARLDALRRARSAADDYAKGLGMRILRVVRVSDRGGFASAGEIVVSGSRVSAQPIPPAPLSQGELTQRTTVWVTYALAP